MILRDECVITNIDRDSGDRSVITNIDRDSVCRSSHNTRKNQEKPHPRNRLCTTHQPNFRNARDTQNGDTARATLTIEKIMLVA
jgi:hypothetical protein